MIVVGDLMKYLLLWSFPITLFVISGLRFYHDDPIGGGTVLFIGWVSTLGAGLGTEGMLIEAKKEREALEEMWKK